jgi:hypothetical protein
MIADEQSHAAQWADYRRRARLHWICLLVVVPVAAVISFAALWWRHTNGLLYTLLPLTLVVCLVTRWRVSTWPCPRCAKWFFASVGYRNMWTNTCLHCQLPKWR